MKSRIKNCWRCKAVIEVKFLRTRNQHSQKNNWGYWTDKQEYKNLFICDNCLYNLYHCKGELKSVIGNAKKRTLLRHYVVSKQVKGSLEGGFNVQEKVLRPKG